jgi:hypothetical protein
MNFNDEQNNASDKHADDPVQSGQSEQNTIRILKPGSNNDLIDQLRGGPLDKTSVNYEYHSPDPTETAQRLALINYFNVPEKKKWCLLILLICFKLCHLTRWRQMMLR